MSACVSDFRETHSGEYSIPQIEQLLLQGELQIQATIDKITITLFCNITADPHSKEYELVRRQLAVKDMSSDSMVVHATKLLRQYDLPSPFFLLENSTGRDNSGWKKQV